MPLVRASTALALPERPARFVNDSEQIARRFGMRRFLLVVLTAVALGACATPEQRTAIGAGGGAAVGAGVGALAGGWEGAAIGALVGGIAGGAVGNYLDKQAQELQQVADARRTENGILVNLKSSLLFSSDSAVLKPAAVEQIAQLGDILGRYPDDRIEVQGHTDSTGSATHNEELSLRRAEAVRDVLASRGVNPRQMLVEGAGAAQPVADNATANGRAANRRVELHIDVPQRS
jgi:outer membrane protein OmpA-like peptidoglycan-associated protein